MNIGARIKKLLKEKDMSGNQLADKVSISSGGMSKIITGNSTPSAAVIGRIAKELDTSTDYLIFGHEVYQDIIETQLLEKFKDLDYDNKILVSKYVTEIWMEQNRPNKEKS